MLTDDEKRELIAVSRRMNEGLEMNTLGVRLPILDLLAEALEGTLTEPQWEYGVRHVLVDGFTNIHEHESLELAREDYSTCGWNCSVLRRATGAEPGPWEVVPDVLG